jgi:hypothetical protein
MTKMRVLLAVAIPVALGVAVGLELHKIFLSVFIGCGLAVFAVLIMERGRRKSQ